MIPITAGYVSGNNLGGSKIKGLWLSVCYVLPAIVGTFSGIMADLPKSGDWMLKIKKALGIAMILIGEYFLIKTGQLLF